MLDTDCVDSKFRIKFNSLDPWAQSSQFKGDDTHQKQN